MAMTLHGKLRRQPETAEVARRNPCPEFAAFKERPQSVIDQFLSAVNDDLKASFQDRRPRIVYIIDEFTYLYGYIKQNIVPSNFMQSWKSLTESGYCNYLLVAQDYYTQFREDPAFSNALQVVEPIQVDYLSEEDVRLMIEEPTRIPQDDPYRPGESRFKGRSGQAAIKRLYELTNGQPWYLMMLCKRLVDRLNRHRSIYASYVDVDRITRWAITGEGDDDQFNYVLDKSTFNNLAGVWQEYVPGALPQEDVRLVLLRIAQETRSRDLCPRSDIRAETERSIDEILGSLYNRGVLSMPKPGQYKIRVGLFKEFLLHRGDGVWVSTQ